MSEEKNSGYESKPRPIRPMRGGRGMPVPKGAIKKGTAKRLVQTLFKYYKWHVLVALVCILINSTTNLAGSIFLQTVIDEIIPVGVHSGFGAVSARLTNLILIMVGVYALIVLSTFIYNRIMAVVSQSVLKNIRDTMFAKMQTLPIQYFDTHAHGCVGFDTMEIMDGGLTEMARYEFEHGTTSWLPTTMTMARSILKIRFFILFSP